ncbi:MULTISPECIES: hypothetical protein [Burkholderia]|uniref:hypothetical protein n=1 Tax=Burkholderia TaxID=32008 RepID=UPI000B7ABDB5|nr:MULTISPECIES: hypothetical protein [Burkholderia]OXI93415.1 hypothetical protein CFB41_33855 [Burkholderia sp. AU33803]PRD89572.1 hypothetical protein C6P88_24870 [Burkholderia contaminans]
MKKIATVLFSALLLTSTCASAQALCKAGKIDKLETDATGNLLVTINDGIYSFNAKEVYAIIYQVYSENRNLFIYGNNCANGSPATRFAIR